MAPTIKRTSLAAAMSPLYKTEIDMVTALKKHFAASQFTRLMSACDADALANRAVDRTERFLTRTNGRSADNATAASNHKDVSEDAPFVYQLNNGSSCVWATPTCHPVQNVAVERAV